MYKDKIHIGKVEALEIMFERNIEELPKKNKVVLTVPAIASKLPILVLGKDNEGFFVSEYVI